MPYASPPLFPRGTVLFSHEGATYEMGEDLGPGPHGERILSALQRSRGGARAPVLLKALPLSSVTPALKEARQRLEEEVLLARYLHHPNIARVHGAHRTRSTLFVITEAVPGCSVNTLLEVAFARGRHFPESFTLYVGVQAASALAHAHSCRGERGEPLGIVHRAIDPSRLRVTLEGQVKLTDFGLASARLPGQPRTRRPGARGEVYWAAPEVLLGQPEDARSDLFTLGLVLLELATGTHLLSAYHLLASGLWALVPAPQAPQLRDAIARARGAWSGVDAEETLLRAATFTPEDVEAATQALSEPSRAVFRRLLRREPAERHASALTLRDELARALQARGRHGARQAARELQVALREAGHALAAREEGARPWSQEDFITTAPGPA